MRNTLRNTLSLKEKKREDNRTKEREDGREKGEKERRNSKCVYFQKLLIPKEPGAQKLKKEIKRYLERNGN